MLSFDYLASRSGAIIVPACGFDSLPSDIVVYLANKAAKDNLGPEAGITRSQTFVRWNGAFSGGSLATLYSILEDVPKSIMRESRADYYLSFGN